MTPENIMAGFRVTGVYPTDRYKVLPISSPKPSTLCERTGLKFIPLFTPLHSRTPRTSFAPSPSLISDESMADNTLESFPSPIADSPSSQDLQCPFSDHEIMLFSKRKEEGYDIKTDQRYNTWLSLQATAEEPVLPKPSSSSCHSVLSKVLATIPPVTKKPTFTPKSTARIITSEECRHEINEKERKKAEALKEKEERKLEREKKREEKKKMIEQKQRDKQGESSC
jgi:hypothetical protein